MLRYTMKGGVGFEIERRYQEQQGRNIQGRKLAATSSTKPFLMNDYTRTFSAAHLRLASPHHQRCSLLALLRPRLESLIEMHIKSSFCQATYDLLC
jgi:hypothetical protein